MKTDSLKKRRSQAAEPDSIVALAIKNDEPEGEKSQADRVDRRKSKKPDRRASGQVGSAKGIETMFRNAYRAQLDLIALAATKANIMISLNGFIASILMVSGAFIYATEPMFLPPAIVFLVTSVISIYFALWAASPGSSPEYAKVVEHARNLLTGKTTLRKLRDDLRPAEQAFEDGVSNILVFEDLAKLPKDDYLERMQELLVDHNQIYEKMSDQLYWLGTMADKKFKMLRLSYAVFGWGMIFSVLVLVIVRLSVSVVGPSEPEALASVHAGGVSKFEHIYEPSGVEQLADGRLVIIEDEPKRALSIASFGPSGAIKENVLIDEFIVRSSKRSLDDLEGIAIDGQGYVYSITSHSQTRRGNRKQAREQLVRLKIDGNRLVDIAGLSEMENAEGITPVIVNGEPKVLVVSDDGNADKKRPAQYLLISYKQLVSAPSTTQPLPEVHLTKNAL